VGSTVLWCGTLRSLRRHGLTAKLETVTSAESHPIDDVALVY